MGCKDSKVSRPTSKHSNQSGLVNKEVAIELVNKNYINVHYIKCAWHETHLAYKIIIMNTFYLRM